ncbi:PREDICTED: flightin [Ceratosolen solmsi marchali]|uniref:Flightin n=1 Tax=Ceratosolen solmsi marchali TaxID=326594 RepID=A0AAJ7DUS5_9HYME|nr:PREDICTED: flightin [Ceratosolen solmsi marchali]
MWDDESSPWDTEDPGVDEGNETKENGITTDTTSLESWDFKKANLPKANKPQYTLHWVRPLYLNYHYLYNYRQNYYNDVIDWMDKRNKGCYREIPRAQEWAERVIRTYNEKNIEKSYKRSSDMRLLMDCKPVARHYSYHTRAYYSLKYQKIL